MPELLSDEEIRRRLPDGWERDGDEIVREYGFDDYLEGVAFAGEAGEIAQEEFHHPEMVIRYKEIEVRFTTHDAGGITERDLNLSEAFDELFEDEFGGGA
ncbi:pterin-4-alpha-carbinolamine dehydratase [Halalkaliarchaeum desulfuricum]|uniref:Putative pterin-4-alpha-carbinolamine dehydratase n=1 Tax=Halalkaliarchaeum desulfuricum TaxID=2055893 RepID=A0A343TJ73_9EURY|nr:4a-hydroxytetrahydrobiopterin dehydratase [Halalkaliarchaeum desulfuricum]AUX09145.1 pterin-4-alpha-carbinolamine dehydratase [Halalkaliarchaeum desulfuricum]